MYKQDMHQRTQDSQPKHLSSKQLRLIKDPNVKEPEAVSDRMPSQLHELFATMLVYVEVQEPCAPDSSA